MGDTKSEMVAVRFTPEEVRQAHLLARLREESRSELIRGLVREEVERIIGGPARTGSEQGAGDGR